MAEITATTRALLSACAGLMVLGKDDQSLNLFSINSEFRSGFNAIVEFLASEAERISNGRLTVRKADSMLFRHQVQGPGMYLGVCPASTPSGELAQVEPGVILYFLGPYDNGFSIDPGASQQEIAKRRAYRAKANQQHEKRKAGEEIAKQFLAALHAEIVRRSQLVAPEILGELVHITQNEPNYFRLEHAAFACATAGWDFNELVRTVAK